MEGYTEVFSWGNDTSGQLGLGSHTTGKAYCSPRFCTFNVLISQISCGDEHAAFISKSGYLYTMGSNLNGRLGIGDKSISQSSSPCLVDKLSGCRAVYISCSSQHSACIIENGTIFTWGSGEFGALGLGDNQTRWAPQQVNLPDGVKASQVSCGAKHTGLIIEENRNKGLYMWGAGDSGQLGTGKRDNEVLPVCIQLVDTPKQVACGLYHSLVVTISGFVLSMGGNAFGQLGIGTKKSSNLPIRVAGLDRERVTKVACGYHSAAITEAGDLYVWGSGIFGEYLVPKLSNEIFEVKDISIGGNFGSVLDKKGNIWTWGNNTNGELGIGDYERRSSFNRLNILAGRKVTMVACGANFALALGQDVYGEQVKSPVPRKTQERSSSVKRYISPPKRNSKTPHKISSVESARSSASKIHTKIHDKSYYEEASRTGNHKHTDDLSFVDNPMLKKGNESTERHDQKIKDLENELSDMRSSMQRTSDNYKYQAEMHAKETSRLKKLLDEKDKEINELKYNVDIKRNSDNKIIDKLENRLKETETLKDHERNNRIRLENEVNLIDERYAKDLKSKDQEIRKLISDKENLTISYDDAVKQKEKLAELLRLESRRPSKPNEDMYTEELVKRCDQIERSMVTVSRQCENYQIKISNQDKTIVEFKLKIQQLEKENSQLKLDLQEAESKNKQLFTNMEKGLRDRAREFKERTLNLLNTPMGGRVSDRYNLTSPDTTLPLDNSLDIKELHEPTRSISPIQNRTKTDYTSPRLQMKHAQLTQEHQTPPTFREGGGVLKNSLAEIRLRLDLLQENKNELENKINTRL